MTRPKTYGEYAEQTPDVHVDSRVRDREQTVNNYDGVDPDNSWRRDSVDDFLRDVDNIIEQYRYLPVLDAVASGNQTDECNRDTQLSYPHTRTLRVR